VKIAIGTKCRKTKSSGFIGEALSVNYQTICEEETKRMVKIMKIRAFLLLLLCFIVTNTARAERYAILVGISDYEAISDLKYPEADVDYLAQILTQYGQVAKENIKLLKGKDATYSEIQSSFVDWLASKNLTKNDLFIFYFSGHGTLRKCPPGLEPDDTDEFLLPFNAKKGKLGTYIKDDYLVSWLKSVRAKRLVILDACFQGGGKSVLDEAERPFDLPSLVKTGDDLADASDALLTASGKDEPAREDAKLKHGVLTYHLGEAFKTMDKSDKNGDGKLNVKETLDYLKEKIKKQTPQLVSKETLVLIDHTIGTVSINSVPSGASVFVDGADKGKTPLTLALSVGVHFLKLEKGGYQIHEDARFQVKPIGNKPQAIRLKRLLGSIVGQVVDEDGNPISDVSVSLLGKRDRDGAYETTTDASGRFELKPVPGSYPGVVAEKADFKSGKQLTSLNVRAGQDVALKLIRLEHKVGSLSLTSIPPEATVLVNGRERGKTPLTVQNLKVGEHTVKFTLSEHFSSEEQVNITADEITKLNSTLRGKPGSLLVESTPANASVYVDGELKGRSGEWLYGIEAGKRTVRVSRDGYKTASRPIDIPPNGQETLSVTLPKLPPKTGHIIFSSRPADAEIYIDGEKIGTTPMTLKNQPIGVYEVEIKASKHKVWRGNVTVKNRQTSEVKAILRALPGKLKLTAIDEETFSEISGVEVKIDGKSIGTTPLDKEISAGKYTIQLRKRGYKSAERKVKIAPAGLETISVTMEIQKGPTPTRIREKDNAKMMLIPAGEFLMGSDNGDSDEKPVHTVYLDAYCIDAYEVTVGQYKKFIQATGHRAPNWSSVSKYSPTDKHPIVYVSWEDAMAYAKWAGASLPTEAQWEKAARGGLVGNEYPWGDKLSHDYANYDGTGGRDQWEYTAPVGSFPANGYGLYDMAGNVWEWCLDAYESDYYSRTPKRNPVNNNFTNVKGRVVRGGSWDYSLSLRCANRFDIILSFRSIIVGFRCVVSED